jgi:hypothetical protein
MIITVSYVMGKKVPSQGFLFKISNKSVWNKAGNKLKCRRQQKK